MSSELEPAARHAEDKLERLRRARLPVTSIPGDEIEKRSAPRDGVALCLSGGGYRAMLFHLGALIRLNETGHLRRLTRVSSVSGGSIAAGVLGMNWTSLRWEGDVAANFEARVTLPIRQMAAQNIDVRTVLRSLVPFGKPAGNWLAARLDKTMFHGATLSDLPDDSAPLGSPGHGPRFVINATNLRTSVLWRFSRPYMADYTMGLIKDPQLKLAIAVAASAAFPPVLSPLELRLDPRRFEDEDPLPRNARYRDKAVLTDGGVYDNMGLETAWKKCKTVLVSDGGAGADWWVPNAGGNWLRQIQRTVDVQGYQVRRLRSRQLIASYELPETDLDHRFGAYWGIGTKIDKYGVETLEAPHQQTQKLAKVSTRLDGMPDVLQERLVNWGYAVCDAALRAYVDPSVPTAQAFPYPDVGVG